MNYIERSRHDNEEIVFQAQYFWYYRYMVYFGYFLSLLLAVTGVGILVFFIVSYFHLKIRSTERAVTTWRVIQKKGILAVETEEIMMTSLETVTIHQSITDRLMDGGTVRVTGRGGVVIELANVDSPLLLKKHIEHQRMNYGHS
jgi:hypothetical protein